MLIAIEVSWCLGLFSRHSQEVCLILNHEFILIPNFNWASLIGGEGDDRGWDGWMASPTQWTWVWVNSGSWWWTGRPGVLWFMGLQRFGHDWTTELNWTDSSVGKESACNAGNPGLIPRSDRSAGEMIGYPLQYSWASLVAQLVKNLPAMRETWVQSLDRSGGEGKGYPLK